MMLRRIALYAGLLVLLAVLAGLSLIAGRVWVPLSAWNVASSDPRWAIIANLQMPRTILGM